MLKDIKVHWKVMILIVTVSAICMILSSLSYYLLDNKNAFQVSLNAIKNFFVPIGLTFFFYAWAFPERGND